MRGLSIVLCAGLCLALAGTALAQGGCRGGGGGGPRATSGGERARQFTGSIASSTEVARQYVMQMQQLELARQYQMQLQKVASEEAARVAQEVEEKRREKVEAIKKRREDELARRERTRERNLAKRKSGTTELASQTRIVLSK